MTSPKLSEHRVAAIAATAEAFEVIEQAYDALHGKNVHRNKGGQTDKSTVFMLDRAYDAIWRAVRHMEFEAGYAPNKP